MSITQVKPSLIQINNNFVGSLERSKYVKDDMQIHKTALKIYNFRAKPVCTVHVNRRTKMYGFYIDTCNRQHHM